MAYSKQTWDTTSYVNPTRMNHIEDGIESASTATGTEYSSGVSVKDKIDTINTTRVTLTESDFSWDPSKFFYSNNTIGNITGNKEILAITVLSSNVTTIYTCNVSSSNRFIVTGITNNGGAITQNDTFSVFILTR